MKIGIISDTHGHLDPKIMTYFKDVDEIWHAGDIGTMEVWEELSAFKPTIAVYGNIDGGILRKVCVEDALFSRNGVNIFMTHIASKPPKYNPRVLSIIQKFKPNLLVCGHSHILKVMPDKVNNLLFINPGAAGTHGFHKVKTLIRFEINAGKPQNMEVVELGKRGAINSPSTS